MVLKLVLLLFGLIALAIAGLWLNWQLHSARHDRDWKPLYATLPTVQMRGEVYHLTNVRNWTYLKDKTMAPGWLEVTLNPADLKNVYFVVKPFGAIRAIAHTMLAFEFNDGSGYVASVEARREKGEKYGGLKAGFFPMHEYMFVWATERDMYVNNTFLGESELYSYRLELTDVVKRAVLVAMLDETAALVTTPRHYNTFLTNCTNVLARAVNKEFPGSIPWSMAWHLPGYAPDYLHKNALIAAPEGLEVLREKARITSIIRALSSIEEPTEFANALRKSIKK